MKQFIVILSILCSTSVAVECNTDNPGKPPKCKKEKYRTLEPGTCIYPKTYRLLNAIDKLEKNPYNNEFAKRAIDLIEPHIYTEIDTIVPGENHSIPIRIYYPSMKSASIPGQMILYIHGGGFMHGSIEEYDMTIKKLARVTDRIIVSVDYRLAPEHPYPAGLNDVYYTLKWLSENYSALGASSEKIILIGDSAGANLAAALTLKNRDEGNNIILGQVLYYPTTTFLETEFPSRIYFLKDENHSFLLTEEFVRRSKEAYIPDSVDERNPYLSPLEDDMHGDLPPLLLYTAQLDPLRDEGRLFAKKYKEAGHDAIHIEYEGIIHGFLSLYMVFKEAKQSMKITNEFINECCGKQ